MKVTSRDIVEILKSARELGYCEFHLEHEGLQLSGSTTALGGNGIAGLAASRPTSTSHSFQPQPAAPGAPTSQAVQPASSNAPTREGLVAVTAPMSGTFYRSPSPGAAPFVNEGSCVSANDVICIIEVMKLFNSIRAGTAGVIAEIVVDKEASVIAAQPVIWIKPATR